MTLLALRQRLGALGALKLGLTAGLAVAFCVPYFALQRFPLRPAHLLPASALDAAVPFQPGWVVVYQSLYLLMPLTAWLAESAESLVRYARGFLALSAAGFLVFLLFPVAGPRPAHDAQGLYALLVQYDTPLNSFPSLHVALAAYSLLFGRRLAEGASGGAWALLGLGALWTAAIAYSTLATKQHYAIDLPPGLMLAVAAHRWAFGPPARKEHP